jgi:hypothetical protein
MTAKISRLKPFDPEKEFELQSEAIHKYRELHFGISVKQPTNITASLVQEQLKDELARWKVSRQEETRYLKKFRPNEDPEDYLKMLKYLNKNFDLIHNIVAQAWQGSMEDLIDTEAENEDELIVPGSQPITSVRKKTKHAAESAMNWN